MAAVVGHRDRHLHDLDVDLVDEAEALRANRPRDASAVGKIEHGADLMRVDLRPGVPLALERTLGDDADLAAVDEEGDVLD